MIRQKDNQGHTNTSSDTTFYPVRLLQKRDTDINAIGPLDKRPNNRQQIIVLTNTQKTAGNKKLNRPTQKINKNPDDSR